MIAIATGRFDASVLAFTRPRAVLTRMCFPSQPTQIGVTCGLPSLSVVARLAKAGLVVSRSRCDSGIVTGMTSPLARLSAIAARTASVIPRMVTREGSRELMRGKALDALSGSHRGRLSWRGEPEDRSGP